MVAVLSILKHWLTVVGALAMVIMGMAIDYAFGIAGLLAIFIFFISSELIGLIKNEKKAVHETRTVFQVMANGGVPLITALGAIIFPHPLWCMAYLVSVAEASADTWASELGKLKAGSPFHLKFRKRVPTGVSGAISWPGSLAALIGSMLIALYGSLTYYSDHFSIGCLMFIFISVCGWLGQFIDTLLGAYGQACYHCQRCETYTDSPIHCDIKTRLISGYPWMTNNLVNGYSSLFAGLLGSFVYILIQPWIK